MPNVRANTQPARKVDERSTKGGRRVEGDGVVVEMAVLLPS
jgi:hypothetical protein